jgi:transposase-like protein
MIDLSNYFCPNPKCKDHGIRGKGNITTSTRYGKNKTHLLRCKSCNQRFSENRNTIFMHSNYSRETIQRIILAIAECNSIRGTARILSLDKDGVNRVVLKAGEHCKEILQNLIGDLCLNECQLDELWTFIKKRKLFATKTSKKNMAATGSGHP